MDEGSRVVTRSVNRFSPQCCRRAPELLDSSPSFGLEPDSLSRFRVDERVTDRLQRDRARHAARQVRFLALRSSGGPPANDNPNSLQPFQPKPEDRLPRLRRSWIRKVRWLDRALRELDTRWLPACSRCQRLAVDALWPRFFDQVCELGRLRSGGSNQTR